MKINVNEPVVGVVPHNGKFYALVQNFGTLELRDEGKVLLEFLEYGTVLKPKGKKHKVKVIGGLVKIEDGTFLYRGKHEYLTMAKTLKDAAIELSKVLLKGKK